MLCDKSLLEVARLSTLLKTMNGSPLKGCFLFNFPNGFFVIFLRPLTNLSFLNANKQGLRQAFTTRQTGGNHQRRVRFSLASSKMPPPRKMNQISAKFGAAKNTKLLRTMALILFASLDSRSTPKLRADRRTTIKMCVYNTTTTRYTNTRHSRISSLTYIVDILCAFLKIKHICPPAWLAFASSVCTNVVHAAPTIQNSTRAAVIALRPSLISGFMQKTMAKYRSNVINTDVRLPTTSAKINMLLKAGQ